MKKEISGLILFSIVTLVSSLGSVDGQSANFDQAGSRPGRWSDWSRPVNLGPGINTVSNDLAAAISADGQSLFFSSDRAGSGGEDIWVSQRSLDPDMGWSVPVNLGPIVNSGSMDRLRSISPDGRVLLFQSNRPGGEGGNDIWASIRGNVDDDFSSGAPVNLGRVINTNSNEVAANYFFDGEALDTKLFFSSSRSGGIGAADIYLTTAFDDGNFGVPVNVLELNSSFNDTCFWVSNDGLEIIFSSTRAGFDNDPTSFDLWTSKRKSADRAWSPPVSLGEAINVEGYLDVNPNVSSDGRTMLFTSDRPGGYGGSDIYMATRRRVRSR